ncbi:MAG: L,D-transpeptidase [Anaerolineaceae bacterium]|nr:L,D-transpeptidase [Anaerolineaceae bacterium]
MMLLLLGGGCVSAVEAEGNAPTSQAVQPAALPTDAAAEAIADVLVNEAVDDEVLQPAAAPVEESGWYASLPARDDTSISFAMVTSFPAYYYDHVEDAVNGGARRTLPGAEIYVSYFSTQEFEGKTYYEIAPGKWMSGDLLEPIEASEFRGIEIRERPEHAFGWVIDDTYSIFRFGDWEQEIQGNFYPRYRMVEILGQSCPGEQQMLQIGANEWIRADAVSLVALRESAPSYVRNCRWIEVNLDAQNLVVYDQCQPVFATLISAGREPGWTGTGAFTIYNEHEANDLLSPDPVLTGNYFLQDVPHILYYEGSWALHGAYWHDQFGKPYSHGCVNLSLRDADWLYDWAVPGDWVVLNRD